MSRVVHAVAPNFWIWLNSHAGVLTLWVAVITLVIAECTRRSQLRAEKLQKRAKEIQDRMDKRDLEFRKSRATVSMNHLVQIIGNAANQAPEAPAHIVTETASLYNGEPIVSNTADHYKTSAGATTLRTNNAEDRVTSETHWINLLHGWSDDLGWLPECELKRKCDDALSGLRAPGGLMIRNAHTLRQLNAQLADEQLMNSCLKAIQNMQ